MDLLSHGVDSFGSTTSQLKTQVELAGVTLRLQCLRVERKPALFLDVRRRVVHRVAEVEGGQTCSGKLSLRRDELIVLLAVIKRQHNSTAPSLAQHKAGHWLFSRIIYYALTAFSACRGLGNYLKYQENSRDSLPSSLTYGTACRKPTQYKSFKILHGVLASTTPITSLYQHASGHMAV